MGDLDNVTVDKSYFDALLRRADFHTSSHLAGSRHHANVNIARSEYDSLLQASREYDLLKTALFQGGLTAEMLDVLISGAQGKDERDDPTIDSSHEYDQAFKGLTRIHGADSVQDSILTSPVMSRRLPATAAGLHNRYSRLDDMQPAPRTPHFKLSLPSGQRQVSYGLSSAPEEQIFDDDDDDFNEGFRLTADVWEPVASAELRTVYLNGLSERTTYADLVSVLRGGKILSLVMRPERAALVSFVNGAADFIAWAKRNDLYVHAKRIEVKWADRQYRLNDHIAQKIAHGATRNLVIHSAAEKGLTEQRIREDMDHIHNLVIINVTFRSGSAYVSTNSVHNALFARTCMMSRSGYKGCKVEFFRDACDVPLPTPTLPVRVPASSGSLSKHLREQRSANQTKQQPSVSNRFNLLNIDGIDGSSEGDDGTHSDMDGEMRSMDLKTGVGVSLRFLDVESTA